MGQNLLFFFFCFSPKYKQKISIIEAPNSNQERCSIHGRDMSVLGPLVKNGGDLGQVS